MLYIALVVLLIFNEILQNYRAMKYNFRQPNYKDWFFPTTQFMQCTLDNIKFIDQEQSYFLNIIRHSGPWCHGIVRLALTLLIDDG